MSEVGVSADLRSLLDSHRMATRRMMSELRDAEPLSAHDAFQRLSSSTPPLNERLTAYIAGRYGTEDSPKSAKRVLREGAKRYGFEFSSANLSQWLTSEKWEISLGPQSIFKLCLALELDRDEGRSFAYDCLHQNWFNLRNEKEAIYSFGIAFRSLWREETYGRTIELLAWLKRIGGIEALISNQAGPSEMGIAGYTRVLSSEIRSLGSQSFNDGESAMEAVKGYITRNASAFQGILLSGIKTYDTYFEIGAIGITPLRELYREKTGLSLPRSQYLDNARITEDYTGKRLLWGAVNRSEWLKENKDLADLDPLNRHEILLEEHAVGAMHKNGVLRGNIVALLFFHFCFEHDKELSARGLRRGLFDKFYRLLNTTLVDECGMMPLHPLKQFDALFLRSIAQSESRNPIEFLNHILETFYS